MADYSVKVVLQAANKLDKGVTDAVKTLNKFKRSIKKIPVIAEVRTSLASVKKVQLQLRHLKTSLNAIAVVPKITGAFNTVKDRLRGLAKSVKVKIFGEDKTSPVIGKISGALKGLVALAGAVAIGAGVAGAIGMGSELEQQQVSMKHFIGVNNKDLQGDALDAKTNDYIKTLRENANATPFETGEVVKAGSRALSIADGDTGKAMDYVKLAEDMAALNPGKSIEDAMEALADANVGEMERLKEFGFKMSADDYKAAGGDVFKMADGKGRTLQGFYKGGSEKLANTGAGMWSTITGTAKSGVQDAGLKMLEALKPTLAAMIPLMNQMGPVFDQIGTAAAGAINFIITGLQQMQPYLAAIWQQLQPVFAEISAWAGENLPVIWDGFMQVLAALEPVVATLIMLIGVFWEVFKTAWPILRQIGSILLDVVAASVKFVCGGIQALATIFKELFDVAAPILKAIADLIGPIVEGIAKIASGIGNKLAQWAGGGLSLMGGAANESNTSSTVSQTNNITVGSAQEASAYTAGALPDKYVAARG